MLKKPSSKTPFPPSLRSFATTLHFYSAKAYEYVRKTFIKTLPHRTTISKWYRKINVTPGINKVSLEVIKRKVAEMIKKNPRKSVFCNLVFDEMKIKKRVEVINGIEYGFIDLGDDKDGDGEATDCLVLMLVCTVDKWKIPVSHYFIKALTGKAKYEIIKENLIVLHETNVFITSLTFDGLESNFAMCHLLEASTSIDDPLQQFFLHPITKEKVFIICDGCHVLKLLRNSFADLVMYDSDNKIISWSFLVRMVEYQEVNGLHAGNKLNRDHINFRQNVMNVKLAAQTLSQSVSDALTYFAKDLKLASFQDAEGTAKFCSMINTAFDILNSREKFSKHDWKKGISIENISKVEEKVKEIIEYVKRLRLGDGTPLTSFKRKTGFIGLIISLTSVLDIYRTYFKKENAYLLTYKLSQDHIEVFFSAIRSKGGYSNNPTCYQFNYILKQLIVHADIKGSERGNCIAQDDTDLLKVPEDILKCLENEQKLLTVQEENIPEIDYDAVDEELFDDENCYGIGINKKYIDHVVGYIAGFVMRSILKRCKCSICPVLLTNIEEPSESALLERKTRGRLIKACPDIIEICQIIERQFRLLYKSKRFMNSTLCKILPKKIPKYLLNIRHSEDPEKHRSVLINEIIKTYIRIRQTHCEKQRSRPKKKVRRIFAKLVLNKSE